MAKGIDDRLLTSYKRIRGAAKNGLAVVPIEREASAGSYIKIPPQRQIDIAQRKRIIVDEHSGRILVDKELAEEETTRMDTQIGKALTKAKK
jgi:predicted  nucleic acid-binding Zn-ribbon protein